MFKRIAQQSLHSQLTWSPAVAILGPRQIGKTTLARSLLSSQTDAIYLDLESPQDLARLGEGPLFLQAHADRLVILDEVQNAPELFSVLRGEIDRIRRPGRFVLLGSASFELLRQSQSLAGRLSLIDMFPLLADEVGTDLQTIQNLWLRGGFPPSFTAVNEQASWAWREAFIRHLLNTDLPALGLKVDATSLSRFWRMLAHMHGQLFNASAIANSLGVSAPTVTRWLDHIVGALLVRRLEPFHANLGKRLVKSHKVYVRDSGLLHSLLGLTRVADLQGQLDVVVESGQHIIGFEIKFSVAPKVSKGFWQSLKDVRPQQTYIVAPVQQRWPFAEGVEVITVGDIAGVLAAARQ